jgi:hypothetical protein
MRRFRRSRIASPDPTGSGLQLNVDGDLNRHNPALQHASKVCGAARVGVPELGRSQPGMIELNGGPCP